MLTKEHIRAVDNNDEAKFILCTVYLQTATFDIKITMSDIQS